MTSLPNINAKPRLWQLRQTGSLMVQGFGLMSCSTQYSDLALLRSYRRQCSSGPGEMVISELFLWNMVSGLNGIAP